MELTPDKQTKKQTNDTQTNTLTVTTSTSPNTQLLMPNFVITPNKDLSLQLYQLQQTVSFFQEITIKDDQYFFRGKHLGSSSKPIEIKFKQQTNPSNYFPVNSDIIKKYRDYYTIETHRAFYLPFVKLWTLGEDRKFVTSSGQHDQLSTATLADKAKFKSRFLTSLMLGKLYVNAKTPTAPVKYDFKTGFEDSLETDFFELGPIPIFPHYLIRNKQNREQTVTRNIEIFFQNTNSKKSTEKALVRFFLIPSPVEEGNDRWYQFCMIVFNQKVLVSNLSVYERFLNIFRSLDTSTTLDKKYENAICFQTIWGFKNPNEPQDFLLIKQILRFVTSSEFSLFLKETGLPSQLNIIDHEGVEIPARQLNSIVGGTLNTFGTFIYKNDTIQEKLNSLFEDPSFNLEYNQLKNKAALSKQLSSLWTEFNQPEIYTDTKLNYSTLKGFLPRPYFQNKWTTTVAITKPSETRNNKQFRHSPSTSENETGKSEKEDSHNEDEDEEEEEKPKKPKHEKVEVKVTKREYNEKILTEIGKTFKATFEPYAKKTEQSLNMAKIKKNLNHILNQVLVKNSDFKFTGSATDITEKSNRKAIWQYLYCMGTEYLSN